MLMMYAPGLLGYRLELPEGLDSVEPDLSRMFWVLGGDGSTALSSIKYDERKALLSSLAQTLQRAAFYNLRFQNAVTSAIRRRELVGGSVTFDTISGHIYAVAGPLLTAARGFVEEVIFIGGRRKGLSPDEVDRMGFGPKEILKTKARIEEAALLDDTHKGWIGEVTDYRNALVHRGMRVNGGFYPRNSALREASNPRQNFMLIPDRESIIRPRRPHQWTYKNMNRLDDLIDNVVSGLVVYASEIGKLWGGSIPPAGTVPSDKRPNILVTLPRVMFYTRLDVAYVAFFSEEEKAKRFFTTTLKSPDGCEVHELSLSQLDSKTGNDGGEGFRIALPAGNSWDQFGGAYRSVRILLDPTPEAPFKGTELGENSIQTLKQSKMTSEPLLLPKTTVPDWKRAFVIRHWASQP